MVVNCGKIGEPTTESTTMTSIDRSATARAMAKAIAYKQCGKNTEAAEWARELMRLLECADILADAP
jgi:hypothetical protein